MLPTPSPSGKTFRLPLPESPKSDNIQHRILASQKHLARLGGGDGLCWALALGPLALGSLPILSVCILDPCRILAAVVSESPAGLSGVRAYLCVCSCQFQVGFPALLSFGLNSCQLLTLPLSWAHTGDLSVCFGP